MKITRGIDVNIEPHPFTVEEFTKDNPLVSEILRTGGKGSINNKNWSSM